MLFMIVERFKGGDPGNDIWPVGDPRRAITLDQMLRMST